MILHILFNILFMFIFHFGIKGAAISLLLSQIISFILYFFYSVISHQPFIGTFFETFNIPFSFIKKVYIKVFPLIINETLFNILSQSVSFNLGILNSYLDNASPDL